ncbi:MAG TPA: heme-copper oxidase subunit III [Methylomirabilota bacterium]|nr:heme-copper oxidase subunit III [Methylomirabilota bacterium]
MSQVSSEQHAYPIQAETPLSRAGWGKLAMWLFLASDSVTFGGLITSHLILRLHNADWPRPTDHLAFSLGLVMTALLLSSSVTMRQALAAVKRSHVRLFKFFMLFTIGAGVAFLLLQAYEWRHLLQEGLTVSGNPWGAPLFGATFYTLTGFHGLHVFAGIVYLSVVLLYGMRRTDLSAYYEHTEMAGLYWHFVDIVWMFVFTCVYVL